jgi:hypothetical protein
MGIIARANLRLNRTLAHWRVSHRDLPSIWSMIKQAASEYRQDWWLYIKILLIVLVPSALITNFVLSPEVDTSLSAYVTLANSLMNAALVLAIVKKTDGIKMTVKAAYYEGSAMLVRLLLLTVLIGIMLLPLIIGLIIFTLGFADAEDILSISEKVMLVILSVIFTIPSLTMLTRAIFSLYVVAETSKGPWEAVVASREIVKGRALAVFGRLAALILLLMLIVAIPTVGLIFLGSSLHSAWPALVLQILIGLIVLPYSNLYLYRLYQELK